MKPALEYLPRDKDCSFVVKFFDYAYFPTPWHYHPEYEIVMVTESTGKRIIGDNISEFKPGNLAYISSNIPHTYKNDEKYYEKNSTLRAQSIVIHFTKASLGNDFLQLPEATAVNNFLDKIGGFDINGKTHDHVAKNLFRILRLSGLKKIMCLIDTLYEIAESKTVEPITDSAQTGFNPKEAQRMSIIFDWVAENLEKQITLSEAAKVARMNENAFSRYFSQRTRKTFSSFIQDLRLQKAAKLITENELPITQICYECGYNNISNFNRQFLSHYMMSPRKYRTTFQKLKLN